MNYEGTRLTKACELCHQPALVVRNFDRVTAKYRIECDGCYCFLGWLATNEIETTSSRKGEH